MSKTNQIKQLIEDYQSMKMARNHLKKLNLRIQNETKKCVSLQIILDNEYNDIEALEKMTVSNMFFKLLKNKEEQMEIEKQEYLQAALRYNQARKILEKLKFEKQVLEEKLSKEQHVKAQLDAALLLRTTAIEEEYPALAKELNPISYKIDQQIALKRELNDAILVGLKVIQLLKKMTELLKKVIDWGKWKRSALASSRIPTKKAPNKIEVLDQASEISVQVQQLLMELQDELEDIYNFQRIKGAYTFEELEHFVDIYHNRLVSDWIIRKKIQGSLNNVVAVQDSISRITGSLKQELKQADISINYLEQQREELILNWKG